MFSRSLLLFAGVSLIHTSAVLAQTPATVRPTTGPLAKSGGAEIVDVSIERRKAAYAAPEADLVYSVVDLWFPMNEQAAGELVDAMAQFSVRLKTLEKIEDDLGVSLLTDTRKERIPELDRDVVSRQSSSHFGRHGPVVRLQLDAPSPAANALKRIKGVAEVRPLKVEILVFEKLQDLVGKPLQHAALRDFSITPVSATVEGKFVTCVLDVPTEHSQIRDWTLMKSGRPLRPFSEGKSPGKGRAELSKTFQGNSVADCSLHIAFATLGAAKVFAFDFQDIELP